ncbi:MAG: hypothetical protein EHM72_03685 [Calditrichaeota bacterium]|nr:MAG: hypothetical protein EHM72_03685 [Calditrichota bacterium]
MKAVIIAAGQSSRLWKKTDKTPKTLLPYGKKTILSTIIQNLKKSGISEIILVIGWEKERIIEYIKSHKSFGLPIQFVENPEWRRGNGLSVYAVKQAVGNEPFILSMCDHIVSPQAIKRLVKSGKRKNLLLVDKQVEKVFDIDDATKVEVKKKKIVAIGKELIYYNAIDCGIFRLNKKFFRAMKKQLDEGQESISAAVTGLIEMNNMAAVKLKKSEFWIDIDTPESYQFALERLKEGEEPIMEAGESKSSSDQVSKKDHAKTQRAPRNPKGSN